ncbi:MAG: PAS domain S-box protein [Mojavia pulchra JT2-VF2]|jgi:PAS domain S-box-containing protein|uniref:Circadian input-output histidine kinase CikA n=1 Tax=Mojavia pulchra JT2-VF2 TaxID=287848 RepID=A0A951UHA2_9NOST|nr:PAS domain S-box protein [Mojavia pulchra JT2-VF2]
MNPISFILLADVPLKTLRATSNMLDTDKPKEELIKELAFLRQRVVELEQLEQHRQLCQNTSGLLENLQTSLGKQQVPQIQVSGCEIEWQLEQGVFTIEKFPAILMWLDNTVASLMSAFQAMVGTQRFALALQSEGRKSVEIDWQIISQYDSFAAGFAALAKMAIAAGWGEMQLLSVDTVQQKCHFRIKNSWEGRYQRALGVCWGSNIMAGKFAGFCSKLFGQNCWSEQTAFIATGDEFDEFLVQPSTRSIEDEIEKLLATDNATRADMAVALQRLSQEILERTQAEIAYNKSEQALRETEERLQVALTSAQAIAWDINLKTDQVVCSENAESLWGIKSGTSENFLLAVHPDDLPIFQQAFTRAIAGEEAFFQEYRVITPDGEARWLNSQGKVYFDSDGQAQRVIGVSLDITQRKQVEAGLRHYQLLSQHSRDIVLSLGSDGQILEANEAAVKAYGYDRTELLALKIADLRAPETQTILTQQFEQASQYGILFETVHLRKDGSFFPVEVSSQSAIIEQKKVVLSIIRDITERKQAEADRNELLMREQLARAEAEAAEQRARFLAEASRVLANSLDYKTTLTSLSHLAVPQVADWCAVDLLNDDGKLQCLAIHHQDPEKVKLSQELRRRYATHQSLGAVRVIQTGKPELITNEILDSILVAAAEDTEHLQALRSFEYKFYICVPLIARGRLLGTITLITAESGRHYSLVDLSLAKDLARRTALAVDNARLYSQAQEANRIKDEFLAVLSHELRSPLNPILGWARLLQSHKFDETMTLRALETIERNAKLQAQLIEDLLDLSRILQGKLNLNISTIDIAATIQAALETVRLSAEAKSIQIQILLEPNVGQIAGDPNRLQQIVWNLLSNAVKFSPIGGLVEIKLKQVDSYAQIQVTDTGQGIKPSFLPYVFDSFRQADSATTRKFGGLGLGLAIVRHLVDLHGGTVQADSPGEGMGATFTVQLPLLANFPVITRDSGRPSTSINLQGIKILAVDDEADMRELLACVLNEYAAEVTVVASAVEFLEKLKTAKPNLLLSDIGMPGMDGYMLMQRVRTLPASAGGQIPAIALTAYAGEINQQLALLAGFQMHLAKPIDPVELVSAISKLLCL